MLPPDVKVQGRTVTYDGLVNEGSYSHVVKLHFYKPAVAKQVAALLEEHLSGLEVRKALKGEVRREPLADPVRNIHIQDSQLQLFKTAVEFLLKDLAETGATQIWTPEQQEEAKLLAGCIKDTVGQPQDDILYGFCL